MRRALICGVSGQDGALLAHFLLERSYEIWGASRDAQVVDVRKLDALGITDQVRLVSMVQTDFRSVLNSLKRSQPDEIYLLGGQSSVGLSFEQPAETIESIALGALNVMEAMRLLELPARLYHASSSECFGDVGQSAASEETPFRPRSPYAVAKASAHWLVSNYREAYGLHASNGIAFNHESCLRPERFVTQKVVAAARRIQEGSDERLRLGRLDVVRDWGWAREYVEAMWLMLQQPEPSDYVLATGEPHRLEEFVQTVFELLDLDWTRHVEIDPALMRPSELDWSQGDPSKAERLLKWRAIHRMADVARMMVFGDGAAKATSEQVARPGPRDPDTALAAQDGAFQPLP